MVIILMVIAPIKALADNNQVPEIYQLEITSAAVKQRNGYISFSVKLKNFADIGVGEFNLRYRFFDGFGERLYDFVNTIDGYCAELLELTYSPAKEIKPRKAYTVKENYTNYSKSKEIQVAVSYYRRSDGRKIVIPDNQLRWYSSKTGFVSGVFMNAPIYEKPSQAIIDRSATFKLGINSVMLHKEDSARFFYSQGGVWLTNVDEDSIADKCGLKKDDLIIKIDKTFTQYEPYALELAKARMADGNTVLCMVERNNNQIIITLRK